jgi:hypothetical protein
MSGARMMLVVLFAALPASPSFAQRYKPISGEIMPDTLELSDGTRINGLILRNSAHSLLFRTRDGEREIPKSSIRRIHDEMEGELVFPELAGPGRLPSWRAMIFDLRHHDAIHALQQIPPVTIKEGYLRSIPYLSFRVNEQSEFNVYGDPDDPVAIEFGMYGQQRRNAKYHRAVREFLAGHLQSREQIAALYSLAFAGEDRRVGSLAMKITPPSQTRAHGGWWISVYNPRRLESARVGDAEYAQLTRPFDFVNRGDGRLRAENVQNQAEWLASTLKRMTGTIPKVRGFYRDKAGVFRIIGFGSP